MSWHYSRAMAAASSAAACSGGEPSAPLNPTLTPGGCSCPARMTAACQPSQSGMTCGHSTGDRGLDVWMSFLAASHAKTSPLPEKEQASAVSGPGCGLSSLGSFARFDRDSSSWKTPQLSLLEGSELFSGTWPRWGLMRDGECWAQSMPAHLTAGSGSGSLPTPRATDGSKGSRSKPYAQGGTPLSMAVKLWPTPTVCGNYNRKGASPTSGDGLATAVAEMLPTPTCNDAKNNGPPSQADRNSPPLNSVVGGPLNPTWVEWLMGWPLGWTDCEVSATDKFQQWRRSHGGSLQSPRMTWLTAGALGLDCGAAVGVLRGGELEALTALAWGVRASP